MVGVSRAQERCHPWYVKKESLGMAHRIARGVDASANIRSCRFDLTTPSNQWLLVRKTTAGFHGWLTGQASE